MSPPETKPSNNGSRCFGVVLDTELRSILPDLDVEAGDPPQDATDAGAVNAAENALKERLFAAIDAHPEDLSALCLSGGGIRSATFALGALQALARVGLLGRFHYLSTVSGGGYIGSWLTQWRALESDEAVMSALGAAERTGTEAPQITGIRNYSNYLTPALGLLSADTWAVMALYVRNLLLNWLIFVPFFASCLLVPWLAYALLVDVSHSPWQFVTFVLIGHAALFMALVFSVFGRFSMRGRWLSRQRFVLLVLLPLAVCAACYTAAAAARSGDDGTVFGHLAYYTYVSLGARGFALLYFTSWAVGRILAGRRGGKVLLLDLICWVLSGSVAGLLIGAAVDWMSAAGVSCALTVLGFSAILGVFLCADFFYAGIASFSARGDMDREWLARASGWISAVALTWLAASAVALYSHWVLASTVSWASTLSVGTVFGVVSLLMGKSSATGATRAAATVKGLSLTRIASIAGFIFGLTLAMLLSALLYRITLPTSVLINLTLIVVLGLASLLISYPVNINRFSMHALYRNRLVRAFLGSGRAGFRQGEDPFTGFDPEDNPRMANTRPVSGPNRLFHVINTALNVVSGGNLAWQERKAESFTITRQFCGNPLVRYQPAGEYGDTHGGISLGTAMAISGAAVSANQGYNTSPLLCFLMMLFNVRLGWWLGNPKARRFRQAGPRPALTAALRELAGITTDSGNWIYLSDGGHFENLGLYEMIRRRCRCIVVCDAGCDLKPNFEDLANAVRKVYVDFGVLIDFENLDINPREPPPARGPRCAVARIHYPDSERLGWLLYLKPVYQGVDERADIRGYGIAHDQFPHESTTDQWFSESQLESYRALGDHTVRSVCAGSRKPLPGEPAEALDFAEFKRRAHQYLKPDARADEGNPR